MKNKFLNIAAAAILAIGALASCNKQLDQSPKFTTTSQVVYSDMTSIKQALAKVYGSYTLPGSNGSGASDMANMDAGSSDFLRTFWNLQELPTDESICAWGSDGLFDMNNISWSPDYKWLFWAYNRYAYSVTVATSFIQNTANPPSSFSQAQMDSLKTYRAEARWVRAYMYWALMDLFGNPAFIDDNSPIGTNFMPQQISRDSLFSYIESELIAIQPDLAAPHTNEYGRVDQAGDWALLARMYLNAQVYTGTARWTDAITYASKVINAGYSLMPQYNKLFLADNDQNNPEVIFAIPYDGSYGQLYGGTTFLVQSMIGANTPNIGVTNAAGISTYYGITGTAWGGNRARRQFVALFAADGNPQHYTSSADQRASTLQASTNTSAIVNGDPTLITVPATFDQGIETTKWRNVNSDGSIPSSAGTYCSVDFPAFRLAEMYLIYAEAVLRGGTGGSSSQALSYINALRDRAYGNASGEITAGQLTLQFILDERARELYTEGFRRTDLIRYNEFTTGTYVWDWKGGSQNGVAVDSHYNIYPIPTSELSVNPNLQQNPGYN
jgi:hypothetical protein